MPLKIIIKEEFVYENMYISFLITRNSSSQGRIRKPYKKNMKIQIQVKIFNEEPLGKMKVK